MRSGAKPERAIGHFQLLALGLNGIVGVGIFFAPAAVAADAPGLGLVFVFVATGLALLPAALTFARLGSRFDEDGGPIVFARAAFGERVSFLVGWVAYVSALFSTSAVIAGLTRATMPSFGVAEGPLSRLAPALLASALAAVVAAGLRLSARVWTGLTVLKLLPLLLLVLALAASWHRFPSPAARQSGRRLAARRSHHRLRLPGLRDRAGDCRTGALLGACGALRHPRFVAARDRALRRARARLRRRPAGALGLRPRRSPKRVAFSAARACSGWWRPEPASPRWGSPSA